MQLFIYKMQQLKYIKCSINLQRHVVATTVTKKSMSVASELSRPKMFVSFLMSFVILAFFYSLLSVTSGLRRPSPFAYFLQECCAGGESVAAS